MVVKCSKKEIRGPQDMAAVFQSINKAQDELDFMKEKFWVAGLNTRNSVEYVDMVSLGTLNASLVHPREVFRFAVMKAVASIVLGHNHPSGDPQPSEEDLKITRRLADAGRVLGINVLDHIIIGARPSQFVSLKEKGVL